MVQEKKKCLNWDKYDRLCIITGDKCDGVDAECPTYEVELEENEENNEDEE